MWRSAASALALATVAAAPALAGAAHSPHAVVDVDEGAHVAVVIDFGERSGVSPEVVIRCLRASAGENGSEVLAAATRDLGIAAPSYADSGLLCAIGGYPSSGCGTPSGHGYTYWSYWHGGATWSYANVGPAEWPVRTGDVEGWRFENPGTGSPADPSPEAPSSYAAACAAARSTTVTGLPAPHGGGSAALVALAGAIALLLAAASVVRWRRTST